VTPDYINVIKMYLKINYLTLLYSSRSGTSMSNFLTNNLRSLVAYEKLSNEVFDSYFLMRRGLLGPSNAGCCLVIASQFLEGRWHPSKLRCQGE
jgi:hypothetical protein